MTRGTVVIIGRKNREIELLKSRLEKEKYGVELVTPDQRALQWLSANVAQAVLCTDTCTRSVFLRVQTVMKRHRSYRYVPLLVVTEDAVADDIETTDRVGEVLRLHRITLAEAIRRLRRAIQLTQLAKALQD